MSIFIRDTRTRSLIHAFLTNSTRHLRRDTIEQIWKLPSGSVAVTSAAGMERRGRVGQQRVAKIGHRNFSKGHANAALRKASESGAIGSIGGSVDRHKRDFGCFEHRWQLYCQYDQGCREFQLPTKRTAISLVYHLEKHSRYKRTNFNKNQDFYSKDSICSSFSVLTADISGRNVTDSIAPLVRGVTLPLRATPVTPSVEISDREKEPSGCTTADGTPGKCQDLSNCPQLLLDLTKLRQSLCFKSLFVPGVCCPLNDKPDNDGPR